MNQTQKNKLLALSPQFSVYCKKVRGFMAVPNGMWAVVMFEEFKEWKRDNRAKR